uniref:Uncharacterized protein n=1 Tax=viral metagenome TaxID=1070528 RepID=A0A6M3L344_9ZZZZ
MSADNWAICPKCRKVALNQKEELAGKAKKGYGKLPPEEYEELLLLSRKPIDEETTMREDFCMGTDKYGDFSIEYSAFCQNCDFKFKFMHSESVGLDE